MYIVLSFDFGGNSDVRVHCVTVDGLKATDVYNNVCKDVIEYNEKNEKNNVKKLVELMRFPDDDNVLCTRGVVAFWGKNPTGIAGAEHIASNN